MAKMRSDLVNTNGINLNVIKAGPEDGQLVILLHGFPEFSYGWRNQISALAEAGYCVWAPDQRGYNLSDKPEGIKSYTIDKLGLDIIGLIDAAGVDKAYIVGHDWGAGVTWWLVDNFPERIYKAVTMNVPHGLVMQKHLKSSFTQLLRSWYIFFFQIPWLPEFLLKIKGHSLLARMLRESGQPDTFSSSDLEEYLAAWSQPNAVKSMINWYRAFVQKPPDMDPEKLIEVPMLLIWGVQDVALSREMAQPSIDKCEDGKLVFLEQATHWVQHDEPQRVNKLLLEFLSS